MSFCIIGLERKGKIRILGRVLPGISGLCELVGMGLAHGTYQLSLAGFNKTPLLFLSD